jgi:hypothetical protein
VENGGLSTAFLVENDRIFGVESTSKPLILKEKSRSKRSEKTIYKKRLQGQKQRQKQRQRQRPSQKQRQEQEQQQTARKRAQGKLNCHSRKIASQ